MKYSKNKTKKTTEKISVNRHEVKKKGQQHQKQRTHIDGPSLISFSAPFISETKDFWLKNPKMIIIKENNWHLET